MKTSPESPPEKKREFICSCGKSYLSYAALFTHIKQKHDGRAPGEVIKPKAENKRGRPRKIKEDRQTSREPETHRNINPNPLYAESKNQQLQGEQQGVLYPAISPTVSSEASKCKANPSRQMIENLLKNEGSQEDPISISTIKTNLKKLINQMGQLALIEENQYYKFQTYDTFKAYQLEVNFKRPQEFGFKLNSFLQFVSNNSIQCHQQQFYLFILLLVEYASRLMGTVCLEREAIQVITQVVDNFFQNYLRTEIVTRSIDKEWAFQDDNPTKIMICLINWFKLPISAKEQQKHFNYQKTQMDKSKLQQSDFPL